MTVSASHISCVLVFFYMSFYNWHKTWWWLHTCTVKIALILWFSVSYSGSRDSSENDIQHPCPILNAEIVFIVFSVMDSDIEWSTIHKNLENRLEKYNTSCKGFRIKVLKSYLPLIGETFSCAQRVMSTSYKKIVKPRNNTKSAIHYYNSLA